MACEGVSTAAVRHCGLAVMLAAALLLPATTATAYDRTGEASWYGKRYQGRTTASGEPFDMNGLTAAHRSLAFGTRVRVTNLANRRAVLVRINDRGPYARGRLIDLSHRAARELGFVRDGITRVRVQAVPEARKAQQARQVRQVRQVRRNTPSPESIRESLRIDRGAAPASQPAALRPPGDTGHQPMREVSPGVWVAPFSDAP